jgi:hypothetical protein
MEFISQFFCCNIFSNSYKRKKFQIKDEDISIADFTKVGKICLLNDLLASVSLVVMLI